MPARMFCISGRRLNTNWNSELLVGRVCVWDNGDSHLFECILFFSRLPLTRWIMIPFIAGWFFLVGGLVHKHIDNLRPTFLLFCVLVGWCGVCFFLGGVVHKHIDNLRPTFLLFCVLVGWCGVFSLYHFLVEES